MYTKYHKNRTVALWNRRLASGMRHHFVPRGGCRRRSRLGKSTIATPTLDDITVVRTQGSTLTRASRDPSHQPLPPRRHGRLMGAVVAHVPQDPPSRYRNRSPLTIVRNSRGRSMCTSGRRCRARTPGSAAATAATSPSWTLHGATAACPRDPMPQPLPPRRRARLRGPSPRTGLRDPPPRACPPDPPSRACPPDPPSRACSQDPPPRTPL
jgi:hypothetical protein